MFYSFYYIYIFNMKVHTFILAFLFKVSVPPLDFYFALSNLLLSFTYIDPCHYSSFIVTMT